MHPAVLDERMERRRNYSDLRKAPRIDLASSIPLAGPLAVYVEPTNLCNFKCVFCPESFANFKEQSGGAFQLSLPDFEMIAAQVKDFGTVKTLNFHMMGEPFINRHLLEFVALAKRERISERVIVTTNGTLLKREIYADVIDSGLDYLRVSIYGAWEDTQKARTQKNISLALIRDNVLQFRQYRDGCGMKEPFIYVKMISQSPEEDQAFKVMFERCGDEVAIEPVMNWNDPAEGRLSGRDTDSMLTAYGNAVRKEVCPFPFYTLVVHSDLRVSVCCVDWNKKAVVGNLKLETLQDIWRGDKLREFQQMHLQRRRCELDACRSCTYLHTAPDNLDGLPIP